MVKIQKLKASKCQQFHVSLSYCSQKSKLQCLATFKILPCLLQSLIISWPCTFIYIHENADAAKLVAAKHILQCRKYNLASFKHFLTKKKVLLKKKGRKPDRFKFTTTHQKSLLQMHSWLDDE